MPRVLNLSKAASLKEFMKEVEPSMILWILSVYIPEKASVISEFAAISDLIVNLFLDPVISLFLKFQCQFLSRGFNNAAVIKDMDHIGHYVIQQTLIMSYHNC